MFWSTQNWDEGAVLTVSPSARQVYFEKPFTVVDDIYDNFYDYSLLQADGKRLLADFATTERDNTNQFGIYVKNTDQGIYHLKVPVVQTEHAIVIDNTTVFNDVIYNSLDPYARTRSVYYQTRQGLLEDRIAERAGSAVSEDEFDSLFEEEQN